MSELICVKFKKLLPNAVIPKYAHKEEEFGCDAGADLVAARREYQVANDCWVYDTGIAMEIPKGYVGLVVPRSSHRKTETYLPNSVGVIDSNYRGGISFSYKNRDSNNYNIPPYEEGDRIGQILIMPCSICDFIEVTHLTETSRGTNGYGSTGK